MAYFKCDNNFFSTPIMNEITKPISTKDNTAPIRIAVLIRLLSCCADGTKFVDSDHLARLAALPIRQTRIVWDICLSKNVLRKQGDKSEFSALEWMKERNLFGTDSSAVESDCKSPKSEQKSRKPSAKNKPDIPAEQEQPLPQEEIKQEISEEPQIDSPQDMPRSSFQKRAPNGEVKFAARENVFLTPDEVRSLHEKYTEEQVDAMLDKLSEYKTQKKRRYASDYLAINRWVVDWLFNSNGNKERDFSDNNASSIIPSWMNEEEK